jgi:glutamate racemase
MSNRSFSQPNPAEKPVGVFDSGVGGLSILRELQRSLPHEKFFYFADQAHVPYGSRSLDEVLRFSQGITRFLLAQNAKLIVVACNTASAAALHQLRLDFPDTPFVGMEPAVKPAVGITQSGVVGVLATPATFQGRLFASVLERFAEGVTVLEDTLPGLVGLIEDGKTDGKELDQLLRRSVLPMLDQGADTLVLACTHYPFIIPALRGVAGPDVQIIDPAPAIARQTARVLEHNELQGAPDNQGETIFLTTGSASEFSNQIQLLITGSETARSAVWEDGILRAV